MDGIFVIKGMSLIMEEFTISLNRKTGEVTSDGPKVLVSYDACIAWARIALSHREEALRRMEDRRQVWASKSPTEQAKAETLQLEFAASMQAVVAAVTCVDALYDHLVPFAPIPQSTRDAWREKGTPRSVQVAETIRATFKVPQDTGKQIADNLKTMYRLRDAAAHPSSAPRQPHKHPELDIGTDWRLTTFRGDVADLFVCAALGWVWDVYQGTSYRTHELEEFMGRFRERVDELLPGGRPERKFKTVNFHIPDRVVAARPSNDQGKG